MIVIDLRPYKDNQKPIGKLLTEHLKDVKGISKIIYQTPDKIILRREQLEQLTLDDIFAASAEFEINDDPVD